MLSRRGATLAEALVALTLTAVILASATGSLLQQKRTASTMAAEGAAALQLRAATALLPAELALASPAGDDLVLGESRDTALQLRVTIASGIACDDRAGAIFALGTDARPAGGVVTEPHAGDSLWWYQPDSARWAGRRVNDAWRETAPCAAEGGPMAPSAVVLLRVDGPDTIPRWSPLRVTRQQRIALYRSGDGSWQVGLREWNEATHAFASPQPVAGPFLRVASDGVRTGFRYFDSAGAELDPEHDSAEQGRVARVRFTATAVPAAGTASAPLRDSADVPLRIVATP